MYESKITSFFEENGFVVKNKTINLTFQKKVWNSNYPNVKTQEAIFEVTYVKLFQVRSCFILDVLFKDKVFAKFYLSIRESRIDEELKATIKYLDLMLNIANVYFIVFPNTRFFNATLNRGKITYSTENGLDITININNLESCSFEYGSKKYLLNELQEFYKDHIPGYFPE